jgi:hypothetical protein
VGEGAINVSGQQQQQQPRDFSSIQSTEQTRQPDREDDSRTVGRRSGDSQD